MLILKFDPFKISGLNVVLHPVNNRKSPYAIALLSCIMTMSCFFSFQNALGQGNITFDLKKPKLYENRKLPSETTPDGKISPVKKLKQNIVTHYNFYFNANNKITGVLASAKKSFKDTFSNLIPVYNYSLDQTAQQKDELDSVIIKCNNGILLHDLRNDWVDNLYFLMGQSYFYQKKFDSAYDVFQYINYTFQPRSKDELGYEKSIGSNKNNNGNVFNISSKEKQGVAHLFNHNDIRNETLVWIVRTLIEMKNFDDAKGLLETLYRDNQFPKRLIPYLAEQKGYWFYTQSQYDSAAFYLDQSIPTCRDNSEKARRCFLIGQLYAKKGNEQLADHFFEKSIALTLDPVMDVFARIQQIGISAGGSDENKKIESNIQALLKMGEREKYSSYKPIIYASAAMLEQKRNNLTPAIQLYIKSNSYNQSDPYLKNKNNIEIAEIAFAQKNYSLAKVYYDSIMIENINSSDDIHIKKSIVADLVKFLKIAAREDSLQKIAAMPETERNIYLLEQLKKIKKEAGANDENGRAGAPSMQKNSILNPTSGSLFTDDTKKGEWYFNNPSLKAQGSISFKTNWGERSNRDNWRRNATQDNLFERKQESTPQGEEQERENNSTSSNPTTLEELTSNLPLTQEKVAESNDRKYLAYSSLGSLYKNKLGNCNESITWNERLISENPKTQNLEQTLFDLSYCYKQNGQNTKASYYQNQLYNNFPSSTLNSLLKDPNLVARLEKDKNSKATKEYEQIYDLFLSGKFEEALENKKRADLTFGENLWSPQLLYIEAIYYIKQKQDSLAIVTLNRIPALYPKSPLANKAGIIADVLNRRTDIEDELTKMNTIRAKEDTVEWVDDRPLTRQTVETIKIDKAPIAIKEQAPKENIKIDTTALKVTAPVKKQGGYQFDINETQMVLILLKNVDIVYINEAKRALAKYHSRNSEYQSLQLSQDKIEELNFLGLSDFANVNTAIEYINNVKALGPKEIFPWLPADKYSLLMISPANYKLMMAEHKLDSYLQFIRQQLPGKF
jgi:outer membrane protein assembly factor BamD (BamD/ComL family)